MIQIVARERITVVVELCSENGLEQIYSELRGFDSRSAVSFTRLNQDLRYSAPPGLVRKRIHDVLKDDRCLGDRRFRFHCRGTA